MLDSLDRDKDTDDHSINHLAHKEMLKFYDRFKPFLKNISAINPLLDSKKYIAYLSSAYIPERQYEIVPIGTYSIDIIEKYKNNIIAFGYGMVGCRMVFIDPLTKQHIQLSVGVPPRTIKNHSLLTNVNVVSYDTQELFQFIEDNSELLIPFSILDNKKVGIH